MEAILEDDFKEVWLALEEPQKLEYILNSFRLIEMGRNREHEFGTLTFLPER